MKLYFGVGEGGAVMVRVAHGRWDVWDAVWNLLDSLFTDFLRVAYLFFSQILLRENH